MDFSIIAIVVQLIFLEGILSIDNAAVLGAMVTVLPKDQLIPWPASLAWLGKLFNKPLGHQRQAALRVGLIGAYVGRGIMLVAASYIIQNPWLKLIGAAYLIRLALEDLGAASYQGTGQEGVKKVSKVGFWVVVLNVELMDLAFSLDNVVAAVSLSDRLWVVMLGVAIGILVMRFAAGLFSYVIQREPALKSAAYILVLNIGIELLVAELAHVEISDWMRFAISIATILLTLAYAHLPFLHIFRPLLLWLSRGLGLVNGLVSWVFEPLGGVIWLFGRIFRRPTASTPS
jgi:tellurite resistance protein TerC